MDFVHFFASISAEDFDAKMMKYNLYIRKEQPKTKRKQDDQLFQSRIIENPIEINLWCFDASQSVQVEFWKSMTSILMSGILGFDFWRCSKFDFYLWYFESNL